MEGASGRKVVWSEAPHSTFLSVLRNLELTHMAETLKVLLVEDSEEDADLISLALQRGGFRPKVQRVETRQAMEEALNVCAFDVVVADFSMPRFTMREALEVVR